MFSIKEARLKIGLTQKQAAEFLEVPLRTWEDWEAGKRKPPIWAEKLIINKLKEEIKMLKIKKENFTEVGHYFDYELENGTKLHSSEWNGEFYSVDGAEYYPVNEPISFDDETGEADQWDTIGFEKK